MGLLLADQPCAHQGMIRPDPAASTRAQAATQHTRVSRSPIPHGAAAQAQPHRPNKRDLSVDMPHGNSDLAIKQVEVALGLKDTSKAAELDCAYKKLKGRG